LKKISRAKIEKIAEIVDGKRRWLIHLITRRKYAASWWKTNFPGGGIAKVFSKSKWKKTPEERA